MTSLLIEREGCFLFEPFIKQGVLAAFSTRIWNFESSGSGAREEKVWSNFCKVTEAPMERIAHFKQVHGDELWQEHLRETCEGRSGN